MAEQPGTIRDASNVRLGDRDEYRNVAATALNQVLEYLRLGVYRIRYCITCGRDML